MLESKNYIDETFKDAETAEMNKEEALTKLNEAKHALQEAISPTYLSIGSLDSYHKSHERFSDADHSTDKRFFAENIKINFELASSMMRAILDDSFKKKMKELYSALDYAQKEYDDAVKIYEDKKGKKDEIDRDVMEKERKEKLPLEWGPELGQMSWEDAINRASELNRNLREGERKWRLPSLHELTSILDGTFDKPYWSGELSREYSDSAWMATVVSRNGQIGHSINDREKAIFINVRLVR